MTDTEATADKAIAMGKKTARRRPSPCRWRLLAVAIGLTVLPLLEGVCRLSGWGQPNLRDDPFVGFADVQPLFVPNDAGDEYVVPPARLNFFAKESFPIVKQPDVQRVFCLGGSTVQGRPYSIPTAFTNWLEIGLNRFDAACDWNVINCGGISYASYRLVPILEECLTHQPDLIILCTGHNEFLEDRTYGDVSRSTALQQASRLRVVNLARDAIDSLRSEPANETISDKNRPLLPGETEPILDFNGGLAVYHRDEQWRADVVDHYEANVRRMIRLCRQTDVSIWLMQPPSNLRDCPPFKSQHREGLSAADREAWDISITAAREAAVHDPVRAVSLFDEAVGIDDQYALTHYEQGRALHALRDFTTAREAFVRARNLDVCPLRMPRELEERLITISTDERIPLIDLQTLLESRTTDGILGDNWLVDHIHPSIEGHQRIADHLLERFAAEHLITLPHEWRSSVHADYAAHLQTLDAAYFVHGQHMLSGLRAWTQGRADGPPASKRFPGRGDGE